MAAEPKALRPSFSRLAHQEQSAQAIRPRRIVLQITEHYELSINRCRTKGAIANAQLTEKSNQENGKNGTPADW